MVDPKEKFEEGELFYLGKYRKNEGLLGVRTSPWRYEIRLFFLWELGYVIQMLTDTECKQSKTCAPVKHHFDECVERVTSAEAGDKKQPNEDCVEECESLLTLPALFGLVLESF